MVPVGRVCLLVTRTRCVPSLVSLLSARATDYRLPHACARYVLRGSIFLPIEVILVSKIRVVASIDTKQ